MEQHQEMEMVLLTAPPGKKKIIQYHIYKHFIISDELIKDNSASNATKIRATYHNSETRKVVTLTQYSVTSV